MKENKVLIEYNVKNVVYNVVGSNEIHPLAYANSITLEKNISTKDKYGDGELVLTLLNDKGSTGTLETTAHDEEFELALGFLKEIKEGVAEVQVLHNKFVNIGFETYLTKANGETLTKKVWLLNVQVAPAGESLSQNTDDINESNCSYPLTVRGVLLKESDGVTDAVDEHGCTQKVFKISSKPLTTNYATFLDSVPTPTVSENVNNGGNPNNPVGPIPSTPALIEIENNQHLAGLKFDTTKTPNFNEFDDYQLSIEQGGGVQLVTDLLCLVDIDDTKVVTVLNYPNNETTSIVYADKSGEYEGMYFAQGWQNLNEDGEVIFDEVFISVTNINSNSNWNGKWVGAILEN